MSKLVPLRPLLAVLSALPLAGACLLGCTGGNDSPPSPNADPPGESSSAIGCSNDPRVKPFAAGMAAKSTDGKLSVDIVSAEPSPPQRGAGDAGINTWTVRVTSNGQVPTDPITVTTLMPDHGHGSPKVPVITPNGDGTFTVSTLFMFMAGVWEIGFSVNPQEKATITLCLN